jgi:hypothetical protein
MPYIEQPFKLRHLREKIYKVGDQFKISWTGLCGFKLDKNLVKIINLKNLHLFLIELMYIYIKE